MGQLWNPRDTTKGNNESLQIKVCNFKFKTNRQTCIPVN